MGVGLPFSKCLWIFKWKKKIIIESVLFATRKKNVNFKPLDYEQRRNEKCYIMICVVTLDPFNRGDESQPPTLIWELSSNPIHATSLLSINSYLKWKLFNFGYPFSINITGQISLDFWKKNLTRKTNSKFPIHFQKLLRPAFILIIAFRDCERNYAPHPILCGMRGKIMFVRKRYDTQ